MIYVIAAPFAIFCECFTLVAGDLGEVFFDWAVFVFVIRFCAMGAGGVVICTVFSCVTICKTFKTLEEGIEFLDM